jgi:hypothetical protein
VWQIIGAQCMYFIPSCHSFRCLSYNMFKKLQRPSRYNSRNFQFSKTPTAWHIQSLYINRKTITRSPCFWINQILRSVDIRKDNELSVDECIPIDILSLRSYLLKRYLIMQMNFSKVSVSSSHSNA